MIWKPAFRIFETLAAFAFFAGVLGYALHLKITGQLPQVRIDWQGDKGARVAGFAAKPVWLDAAPPAHSTDWGTGVLAERTRILNTLDTIEIPGDDSSADFAKGFEYAVQVLTSEIEGAKK